VRIEILSAQAETSARVRSRSACSSRYAARKTRASTLSVPPGRRDPLTDRHPPSLPVAFRKLDAVAVLIARLLPAPLQRLAGEKHRSVQGAVAQRLGCDFHCAELPGSTPVVIVTVADPELSTTNVPPPTSRGWRLVLPEAAYQVIDLIAGKHLESLHAQNVRPACANLLGRCSPGHAHAASGLPGQASAFGTAFWWSLGFTVIAIIPALALPGRPKDQPDDSNPASAPVRQTPPAQPTEPELGTTKSPANAKPASLARPA